MKPKRPFNTKSNIYKAGKTDFFRFRSRYFTNALSNGKSNGFTKPVKEAGSKHPALTGEVVVEN